MSRISLEWRQADSGTWHAFAISIWDRDINLKDRLSLCGLAPYQIGVHSSLSIDAKQCRLCLRKARKYS